MIGGYDPYEDYYLSIILIGVGLALLILVWKTSHSNVAPSYIWVFCLLGFINSIIFIGKVSDQLIDFLTFMQILT